MKLAIKLSMGDDLSVKILDAAIEIKKNTPDTPFGVILKDLVGGVKECFQLDDA